MLLTVMWPDPCNAQQDTLHLSVVDDVRIHSHSLLLLLMLVVAVLFNFSVTATITVSDKNK